MKDEAVLIHSSSWKLADIQGDVDWCRQQTWSFTNYTKAKDHDHCSTCWWALALSSDIDVGQGYVNDNNRWLCRECYGKFIATA
jgi:hypothetical protein